MNQALSLHRRSSVRWPSPSPASRSRPPRRSRLPPIIRRRRREQAPIGRSRARRPPASPRRCRRRRTRSSAPRSTADTEAQLFADARKIVWGRYAKIKGAKPGDVTVTTPGQPLDREGPHRQRGARHRGRLGFDRRRRRAHRGRRRADPRRGRLPRRQGREGHAVQGGGRCSTSAAPASRRSGAWPKATIPATARARASTSCWTSRSRRSPSGAAEAQLIRSALRPERRDRARAPAASARSFSAWPLWPFTQCQSTWCGGARGVEALP